MPKLLECREIKNKMASYKNKIKEMLVKLCKYFNWKDKNAEMLINSSTSMQTNNYEKSKHFEDKRIEIEIIINCECERLILKKKRYIKIVNKMAEKTNTNKLFLWRI